MWQSVSNKKKDMKSNSTKQIDDNTKNSFQRVSNSVPHNATQNVIRYTVDFVYSFENIHKEQLISYELSVKFDKINEMFKTSTQYISSKTKINYNQANHNKWEEKKDVPKSVVNVLCALLNKITNDNYDLIIDELSVHDVMLLDDLTKITDRYLSKCINDTQFLDIYIRMIKHIMMNNKWIVLDENAVPITFRKLFINQLEIRFENLINDVKNTKYDKSEIDLIIIHNKSRISLITLIIELHKNKIIGNQLIRYIFKNLENMYESTGYVYEQYLEYSLVLLKSVTSIWKTTEPQYLNEQIEYIMNKKDKLSLKLQFILEDQIDLLKK